MKTLLKIFALAAAFGMAPVAAVAQAAPAAMTPAPQPTMALPAQPEEASDPAVAEASARPSDQAVAQTTVASQTAPEIGIGQPDGRMGLQDQFSPIGQEAAWFHDIILLPVITVISLFVLFLMLWVIVRFRRSANPTPSRTTHNTLLEVVWTLVPVLILVVIAVPSIRLLARQYSPPPADLTVKVIGNQWYWTYEYPDNGIELVSNMLPAADADARGEPRLLAVDERMVVPVGATVKLIVTSADVIHAFAMPAFWTKIDAVPGRLNETWFRADRPGVYYGQCSELCGARHGYMPIAVEVVSREQFAAWVATKGGTMPGSAPPASPDATAASPLTDATASGSAPPASPEPPGITPGVATPPVTTQGATDTSGSR